MEPVWTSDSAKSRSSDEREQQWLRRISSPTEFSFAEQMVRGHQRRQQTLVQLLIISVIVGTFGNMFAQAVLPSSNFSVQVVGLSVPVMTLIAIGAGVSIILLSLLFVRYDQKYSPQGPVVIVLEIDYNTLLQSYDSKKRGDIEYFMSGAGVKDFPDFATGVLKRATDFVNAVPLRGRTDLKFESKVEQLSDSRYPPEVHYFARLDALAKQYGANGVKGSVDILLFGSSVSFNPTRVFSIDLTMTINIDNPKHHRSDRLLKFIQAMVWPYLGNGFSEALYAELDLTQIEAVRQLIDRTHDYIRSSGGTDDWYLMNCYPYDGKSRTVVVIDKPLVMKRIVTDPYSFASDPLYRVLTECGLIGCYVTDSSNWISPAENRKLFGGPSHLEDELIYVEADKIISIGRESRDYVSETLRDWSGAKPSVVKILESSTEIVDRTSFETQLRDELKANLASSSERSMD